MTIKLKEYESIAVEALSLSMPERRDLVSRLIQSLNDFDYDDSENIAIAEERLRRVRSGELPTIPYEQVIEEIRTKYHL